ncbi:MAG: Ferrous ion uptake system protein FeoB [Caldanaerobacter subterraneus]|jgi:ferrous iron transport protein B|uniref:Ferrous iron transport protein B n=2 Tax=Caldanaerobacter subterraneus TaxID=911092 RepID=Q8R8X7_CALS4|nr:ferrous iron transport protein B [Caldanaerobacter subterraneus]AAM25046.1 Ferrous ion uptake system protein FeoB (predicted GTPase) [Caldanaerobacter subterraneus subsp. tengcongensis MB4]KUK09766.1 MAG: Ferrous ion uptake system protein FeoB [Caldanaerobacter subterraneus]MCS3915370.1 ferrous iron transport protein B [Caldanaerobacter subterraneus subsp. tengcongensis MB4]TCO63590.1 ferrous iron transport protein B [Caldanaerobacter subterraneus]HBT49702.1 ferrous iron transport protein B
MEKMGVLEGRKELVVALAGNPNSGKTSLFNELTGSRQHVGNWPGVTVEKKEGRLKFEGIDFKVVDLPGTYSLGAYTEDEVIARNFIIYDKPDVVINVVDATNLERNLYLTMQLLEMNANLVIALNMSDEAKAKGIEIDKDKLSQILKVPVVMTVATKGEGVKELLENVLKAVEFKGERYRIDYGKELEEGISELESLIKEDEELSKKFFPRWLAIKFIENDENIMKEFSSKTALMEKVKLIQKKLEGIFGEDAEVVVADKRYGVISGIVKECVKKRSTPEERYTLSDRIDRIVTNKYLGIPIFLVAMWAVFEFTFALGNPLSDWIEMFFDWLGEVTASWLLSIAAPDILISFIRDGIIAGVGSVLVFIPPIFLLFFAISVLEDSGYMARAAYVMDRFMTALGLHGKSFIPMLIGFGCNVPGIMATRTLENKEDRLVTILVNPLMSCAARLPVYVLFAGAFFAENQGLVVFSIYLLGIVLAVIMAKIFKKFLFKGKTAPFVMELPPYRVPTLKGLLIHMWERGSLFVRKAGTIILGVVVLVWILSSLPAGVEYASAESYIGRLGSAVAPILKPAGFGTWEAASALIFGILAKETVVGTLGVVYGAEGDALFEAIRQHFTPLSAYAFMVMTLIYIPCVATIAAIRRETNSWKWTFFAIGYTLVLGWLMAVLVYQGGRILGLG